MLRTVKARERNLATPGQVFREPMVDLMGGPGRTISAAWSRRKSPPVRSYSVMNHQGRQPDQLRGGTDCKPARAHHSDGGRCPSGTGRSKRRSFSVPPITVPDQCRPISRCPRVRGGRHLSGHARSTGADGRRHRVETPSGVRSGVRPLLAPSEHFRMAARGHFFGPCAMFNLSPECAPQRTFAHACQLLDQSGAITSAFDLLPR